MAPGLDIHALYPHPRNLSPKSRCFVDPLVERLIADLGARSVPVVYIEAALGSDLIYIPGITHRETIRN
jgi:hypothetical protein